MLMDAAAGAAEVRASSSSCGAQGFLGSPLQFMGAAYSAICVTEAITHTCLYRDRSQIGVLITGRGGAGAERISRSAHRGQWAGQQWSLQ